MPLFVWNQNYEVGIGSIDRQHRRLVDLINQLHDATEAGGDTEILDAIFGDLEDYIQTHFFLEERLMEQHDYPDRGPHKEEHERFTERIHSLRERFRNGRENEFVSKNILQYLKNWLSGHILGVDRQYGPHFKEKGVK